jgi:hypothetical protein
MGAMPVSMHRMVEARAHEGVDRHGPVTPDALLQSFQKPVRDAAVVRVRH